MVEKQVNKVKYSAWEKVGVEKRDLFKRNVNNVKEEQEDSKEAFKDALTRLKEIYKVDGGKLEKEQARLSTSYDEARAEAADVSESIKKLDTVANDLFDEWEEEIGEIETKDLKKRSKEQLKTTKTRYEKLHAQLKQSEEKMQPVLSRFKDQVLFLKHNLNAQAIAGLKTESNRIQSDIEKLMKEMQESSKDADALIKTL
jgi:predicted  nucleic acid-binding Zn-ribbon protein